MIGGRRLRRHGHHGSLSLSLCVCVSVCLLYVEHRLQRTFLSTVWHHLSIVSDVFINVYFWRWYHVEHCVHELSAWTKWPKPKCCSFLLLTSARKWQSVSIPPTSSLSHSLVLSFDQLIRIILLYTSHPSCSVRFVHRLTSCTEKIYLLTIRPHNSLRRWEYQAQCQYTTDMSQLSVFQM